MMISPPSGAGCGALTVCQGQQGQDNETENGDAPEKSFSHRRSLCHLGAFSKELACDRLTPQEQRLRHYDNEEYPRQLNFGAPPESVSSLWSAVNE
jgi:hypothetical protein